MREKSATARIVPGANRTVPSDSELRVWSERADFTAIGRCIMGCLVFKPATITCLLSLYSQKLANETWSENN